MIKAEGYTFFCILIRVLRLQLDDLDTQNEAYAEYLIEHMGYSATQDIIKDIRAGQWWKRRNDTFRNNLNSSHTRSHGAGVYAPTSSFGSHQPQKRRVSAAQFEMHHPSKKRRLSAPYSSFLSKQPRAIDPKMWQFDPPIDPKMLQFDPKMLMKYVPPNYFPSVTVNHMIHDIPSVTANQPQIPQIHHDFPPMTSTLKSNVFESNLFANKTSLDKENTRTDESKPLRNDRGFYHVVDLKYMDIWLMIFCLLLHHIIVHTIHYKTTTLPEDRGVVNAVVMFEEIAEECGIEAEATQDGIITVTTDTQHRVVIHITETFLCNEVDTIRLVDCRMIWHKIRDRWHLVR